MQLDILHLDHRVHLVHSCFASGDWQRQESESRGKPMTVSLASIQEVLDEIRDALET